MNFPVFLNFQYTFVICHNVYYDVWKAVEGGWLTLDHADRLKFRSRLVVTGAIVIGRDDGLFSTSLPVTIQMRFLGFLANDDGAGRLFGDVLHLSEWSALWERSQHRLVNDEHTKRGCRSQYSCSRGSLVLGLELHLLFSGIAPWGSLLR